MVLFPGCKCCGPPETGWACYECTPCLVVAFETAGTGDPANNTFHLGPYLTGHTAHAGRPYRFVEVGANCDGVDPDDPDGRYTWHGAGYVTPDGTIGDPWIDYDPATGMYTSSYPYAGYLRLQIGCDDPAGGDEYTAEYSDDCTDRLCPGSGGGTCNASGVTASLTHNGFSVTHPTITVDTDSSTGLPGGGVSIYSVTENDSGGCDFEFYYKSPDDTTCLDSDVASYLYVKAITGADGSGYIDRALGRVPATGVNGVCAEINGSTLGGGITGGSWAAGTVGPVTFTVRVIDARDNSVVIGEAGFTLLVGPNP